MDALSVARLQFAVTTSLHFLFVILTLGLVTFVAVMQTRWTIGGNPVDRRMTRFWGQLYVINYALGIATGIVMEFQFGLNWSGLSRFVGNVFGAPLAMETLVAFFLESTFLGLWIFGWDRLNRWLHLALIWLVATTAYASALFVITANGFLQHPVGYQLRGGTAVLTDLGALFTNPEARVAFWHVSTAALLTGAVLIAGISAYHLRRRTAEQEFFRRSLRMAVPVAAVMAFVVASIGGDQFELIKEHQPTKLAAGAEAAAAQATMVARYGPGDYLPPSGAMTAGLAVMTAIDVLLLLVMAVFTVLLLFRGWLFRRRLLLTVLVLAVPLPFVAAIGGWVFRELGRQPWLVYGVLKTSDAVSGLGVGTMLTSFVCFTVLLGGLAVADWVLLARTARRGPGAETWAAPPEPATTPIPATL